jgi:signal transduction histidine kinase
VRTRTGSCFRIIREEEPKSSPRPTRNDGSVDYLHGVRTTVWPLVRRYVLDVAVILAALGAALEVVLGRNHKDAPTLPLAVSILLLLAITLPLLARRQFPFGAPAAAAVIAAAASFIDGRLVPTAFATFLTVMAVSFLFGMLRDRRQALAGLAILVAAGAIVTHNEPKQGFGDYVFITLLFGIIWLAGLALGSKLEQARATEERAARLEREREERARAAVAEERARIARELHDVVGHSVSVMTVQASGVRRLLRPEQEREREALLVVEQAGREALAEMRRLVGVLRRPEEAPALAPQPSLEHIGRLIEQARDAGLPVQLRIEGKAIQLPPGIDLTAYRVVQEGLTNAIKHAAATKAEVVVRYGKGDLELLVSDDGQGVSDGRSESGGHGLVGMRERVAVYDGELEAGPRPKGGYALRARLPLS